jgi:hypothetical protein
MNLLKPHPECFLLMCYIEHSNAIINVAFAAGSPDRLSGSTDHLLPKPEMEFIGPWVRKNLVFFVSLNPLFNSKKCALPYLLWAMR